MKGESGMKLKVIVGIILTLLPLSLLIVTFNLQSVKAGSTVVSLNPKDSTVQLGDSFTINVTLTDVNDWGAWEFKLDYDTAILDAKYVYKTPDTLDNTDWCPIDAFGNWWPDRPPTIDDTIGRVWCGALVPVPLGGGRNGDFTLVTINFTATGKGSCTLHLYDTTVGDSWGEPIDHTAIDGSVTVKGISETVPPTWSNAGTNNTIGGQPTLFHVKWTDDTELSGFIFGTNNTGTWANDTWAPMSGTSDWSNVTKILSSTASLVQWTVWANDTSNNWNDTGILSLTPLQPPHAEFTYSPTTPYTGETVTFNATSSYDLDGYIVSYVWDFGDDTTGTGNIATHSYGDDGTYTVILNVTDDDGLSDTFSKDVTVLNRPPVASFTENATTVLTGEAIRFDASSSYDPDGSIASYSWSFGDGTNGMGVTATHSYADDGTYTVTLTVTDDDGSKSSANATKTVLNRFPVASFTESAEAVYTGEVILFNASSSSDPDGTIIKYFWDFGDGTNATGITTTHSYSAAGNYTVTLTVTDDDGATNSANATKFVTQNLPPVASFTENATTVFTGEVISFNASASYDLEGSIVKYFWTFGDGTNATGVTATHSYADDGVYTVTLTVTDNLGLTGSTSATKTVLNRPPVADANGPYSGYEGSPITFDASGSTDVDGDIVLYEWDWDNDGSYDESTASPITSHTWTDDYAGTVGLRVKDDDGLTDTATASVTVHNVAPTVIAGPDQTVYVGQTVNFTGSFTDPGTKDIHTIFWDFGDGTNATGTLTPTHTYTATGNYAVTLTITDDDGGVKTDTLNVTVSPVPVHDIAIIDVVPPSILEVDVGGSVDIKVIVKNEGNVEESFTVKLYAGDHLIETRMNKTLAAGSEGTYTFTWNTAGMPLGEYTIRAEVPQVTGETDTADNSKTTTWGINIIPEFPSWIAWISVIAITSLAVFLGSRKLQRRKHAPEANV